MPAVTNTLPRNNKKPVTPFNTNALENKKEKNNENSVSLMKPIFIFFW